MKIKILLLLIVGLLIYFTNSTNTNKKNEIKKEQFISQSIETINLDINSIITNQIVNTNYDIDCTKESHLFSINNISYYKIIGNIVNRIINFYKLPLKSHLYLKTFELNKNDIFGFIINIYLYQINRKLGR